jgi:hypothetical protein
MFEASKVVSFVELSFKNFSNIDEKYVSDLPTCNIILIYNEIIYVLSKQCHMMNTQSKLLCQF